jgi:carbonic anhydrase/acetyltransferase-like protein (isoleucine patch superfamily)
LAFIKQGEKIPPRSLVAGNPGKIIKPVSDEMILWKTEGTTLYQALPKQCFDTLEECEPLREYQNQSPIFTAEYKPFKKD